MKHLQGIVGVSALAALLFTGCGGSNEHLKLGGSTFLNPMMKKWTSEYHKATGVKITYESVGSGEGIRRMLNKEFDFGCTDGPLADEELEKAKKTQGLVVHIPLVMGGVVPAYTLQGMPKPLRFSGPVLAEIYLGKIKKWNDKKLQDLQDPHVILPDKDITVLHRSDGSGTTYIWSDYLSKVSPEWRARVKTTTGKLTWPCGEAERGNEGMAARLQKSEGAIGYIELTYAIDEKIPFGLVLNQEKEHVKADVGSINAAIRGAFEGKADIPEDLRFSFTNQPGTNVYPISGATFAVVLVDQPAVKGKLVKNFLRWLINQGQHYADDLSYARLSQQLIDKAEEKIDEIGTK